MTVRLVKVSTAPQHQDTVSVGHKKQSSGHMARRNSLDSYELCLYFGAASEEISQLFCIAQRIPFSDYNLMFAKAKPCGLEERFYTHRRDLVLLSVYALESRKFQVLSLVIFAFLWKSWL